jgi:hypothetical protein
LGRTQEDDVAYAYIRLIEKLNEPCYCEKYPFRKQEKECSEGPLFRWWNDWI